MRHDRRVPDFFIVGAPKCGTTSLFEYLREHPRVFLPPKEVHFFGSDLHPADHVREESDYVRLFASAPTATRVGEASVWYLYSRHAAREIKRFSPHARIVISLRDPVDMIHSLHSHLLYAGIEDIPDFERVIHAEMAAGRLLPLWNGVRYLAAATYSGQVERYLDVFGPDMVKIILFDDLRRDPSGVYREICQFLDIDASHEPVLRIVNPNKTVRSATLRTIMRRPPAAIKAVGRVLIGPGRRQRFLDRLQRLNTRQVRRPAMAAHLRTRLRSYFAADVERLGRLLNRDLSAWSRE